LSFSNDLIKLIGIVGNLMPGGIFPPPPAVATLLSQLPHPISFRGPFVSVDDLMNLIRTKVSVTSLDSSPRPEGLPAQEGRKYFATAIEAADNIANSSKRGANEEDDDQEGDGSNLNPPQFDIYRSRQLSKKVRTQ